MVDKAQNNFLLKKRALLTLKIIPIPSLPTDFWARLLDEEPNYIATPAMNCKMNCII